MPLQIRWMVRRPAMGAELRLERFRSTLAAAAATRRYRPVLHAARLGTSEAIARVSSVEATLALLPAVTLAEYRSATADFRNPGAPPWRPHKLHFPLAHVPRTAVLMPGFAASGPVQVFTSDWERRLRRFRPESIAAPLALLRALAQSHRGRAAVLPPLTNSVIAFSRVGDDSITEADRDLFWRVFRVPLFEQLLGFDGRVVARECEAHDGLHIENDEAVLEQAGNGGPELLLTSLADLRYPALRVGTGLTARLERGTCGCGRDEPRLTGVAVLQERRAAAICAAD